LKFPRSTYYKALVRVPSNRQLEADKFKAEIKKIWTDSKARYRAPKIHQVLISQGKSISLKRVQRYMIDMGLRSIVIKKFRYHSERITTDQNKNILNRDFSTTGINQKWCTDITYIYTVQDGWTYLASVMDLHSKKIIGYAYDTSMTELAMQAVKNACLNVKVTEGILLHSDLGIQYTSKIFEDYLSLKAFL